MIYTGLVSVTFRKLPPADIIDIVKKADLDGIEWGGDIHVPHGNLDTAREVRKMTVDAGLKVASYGSYYRAGCGGPEQPAFERVLETAQELQAPVLRIWAGNRGTADSDAAWHNSVVTDIIRISEIAQKAGITLSLEFHSGTLTDTAESTCILLRTINRENVKSYWQPPVGMSKALCFEGLKLVSPWLSNIHVFQWQVHQRLPLLEGTERWKDYIRFIKEVYGDRYCLLEFVKDDNTEQFLQDAATLRKLISRFSESTN